MTSPSASTRSAAPQPSKALPKISPYPLPTAAELPASRVSWLPTPARATLLVHDLQRYFLAPFMAGTEPTTELLANVRLLQDRCRMLGVPVIYTADRGLLRDFWGEGMGSVIESYPELVHIVPEVAPTPDETVLTKWHYSAFHRTRLAEHLTEAGRDQLVITGIYAHIGCLATALEAFMRDVQPFLVADAVADFSRAHHDQALAHAAGQCARVTTTAEVVSALTRAAS